MSRHLEESRPGLSLWRRPMRKRTTILFSPLLFVVLCAYLVVLLCRKGKPLARRFAAATLLLLCRPKPVDKHLYHFCYPDHA